MKRFLMVWVAGLMGVSAWASASYEIRGRDAFHLFSILASSGARVEQSGSNSALAVGRVQCSSVFFIPVGESLACKMVNSDQKELTISGASARELYLLLEKSGVRTEEATERASVGANRIDCVTGFMPGRAGGAATCTVEE